MGNIAFIDGQNLHLGTQQDGWVANFHKLRAYLKDKYDVKTAYYFLGYVNERHQDLYDNLQKASFIVKFREHNSLMESKKKGNVDTDIVFGMMKAITEDSDSKIILVAGDGDYKKTVDYLIKKGRFKKVLFPNREFASSLYQELGSEYYDYLDNSRNKIEHKKRTP